MINEDILFESSSCINCNCQCKENDINFKCPYDKLAEDLIYAEEFEYINSKASDNT